jgi:hypothetical protein
VQVTGICYILLAAKVEAAVRPSIPGHRPELIERMHDRPVVQLGVIPRDSFFVSQSKIHIIMEVNDTLWCRVDLSVIGRKGPRFGSHPLSFNLMSDGIESLTVCVRSHSSLRIFQVLSRCITSTDFTTIPTRPNTIGRNL